MKFSVTLHSSLFPPALVMTMALANLFGSCLKLGGFAERYGFFARYDLPDWFLFQVGASQLVASVAMFRPVFATPAALVLATIAFGGAWAHVAYREWARLAFAVGILALNLWIAWGMRAVLMNWIEFLSPRVKS